MPDQRSPEAQAYRAWYQTARWRKLRAQTLKAEPICRMCRAMGRANPATVVDHDRPHRGDEALFFDPGNLVGLCKVHHDGTKARLERGRKQVGIATDGWPQGT